MINKFTDFRVQIPDTGIGNSCYRLCIFSLGSSATFIWILLLFALLTGLALADSESREPASCMVLITSTSGGSVYPDGANAIPGGSDITLTITPSPGYSVGQVLVDGADVGPVPGLRISPVTHDLIVHVIFIPEGGTLPATPSPKAVSSPPLAEPARTLTSAGIPRMITVGVQGADFTRIQDAITNASPGDTIRIDPGTYHEQIVIHKPLTLIGREGGSGRPAISADQNGTAVLISADKVFLKDLLITGARKEGEESVSAIFGTGISGISLDQCSITDSENGVSLNTSANISISSSSIRDISRYGLVLSSLDDIRIERTSITQCRTDILGENLTHLLMRDNLISAGQQDGAVLSRGITDSELFRNFFTGNSFAGNESTINQGRGLLLEHASNVTIRENQFLRNQGIAFALDEAIRMTVANNTLQQNAAGFSCTGDIVDPQNRIETSNIVDGLPIVYYEGVSGQIIEGISPGALYLQNCSDMTIRGISMNIRNGYGIVAKGGRNLSIINTSVGQNLEQNILIAGVTGGRISGIEVYNGTHCGVGLIESEGINISDSVIRENGIGIALLGRVSGVNLTGNSISGNSVGFQIMDSSTLTGFGEFSNNQISGGRTGIVSLNAGKGIIRGNQIHGVLDGMQLSGSHDLHIEENQIEASIDGLLMSHSEPVSNVERGKMCYGNTIVRNRITAGNSPVNVNDSSEWVFGNSFVLNDFVRSAVSEGPPMLHTGDEESEVTWGGFSLSTTPETEQMKNQMPHSPGGVNTWDTGERVRYTYGNTTYSGYLGNHWSNYTGKEIGASGVGDLPYQITSDNTDSYPLIGEESLYETGRGGYQLDLQAGWNFISTPSILTSGYDTAHIFGQVNSEGHSLYWFKNESWIPMKADDPIKPLQGFWIYSATHTAVPLIFDPGTIPPPVHLMAGWNTIGFPGIQPAAAHDALSSLDVAWSYAMGYNASSQKYEVPIFRENGGTELMYPSHGYWIHMDQAWDLQPITG